MAPIASLHDEALHSSSTNIFPFRGRSGCPAIRAKARNSGMSQIARVTVASSSDMHSSKPAGKTTFRLTALVWRASRKAREAPLQQRTVHDTEARVVVLSSLCRFKELVRRVSRSASSGLEFCSRTLNLGLISLAHAAVVFTIASVMPLYQTLQSPLGEEAKSVLVIGRLRGL